MVGRSCVPPPESYPVETWKQWILVVTKVDGEPGWICRLTTSVPTSREDLLNSERYTDSSTLSQEALSVLDSSLSWFLNQDTGD